MTIFIMVRMATVSSPSLLNHHRHLLGSAGGHDGRLGRLRQGHEIVGVQLSDVRDAKGAIRVVIGHQLAGIGLVDQGFHLCGKLIDVFVLGVLQHRSHQTVSGGRHHADIVGAVDMNLRHILIEAGIHDGRPLKGEAGSPDDEVIYRQGRALLRVYTLAVGQQVCYIHINTLIGHGIGPADLPSAYR